MSNEMRAGKPAPLSPGAKGQQLKQTGIVVCGSSVVVFLPALTMMARRGTNPLILYILLAFWLMDLGLGISFIVRGRKLMQGSERNG
jgi:hypothetical protein